MKNFLPLCLVFLSLIPRLMGETRPSPSPNRTGIEGVISISPVRGGPIRQGVPSSAPLANIAFAAKQGDREIKTFTTGNDGRFQVTLEPGHYTIMRKDWKGAIGSYGPFEVDVKPGKMVSVAWDCDTGLR